MAELPNIPTPASQRIREFRVRFVPPIVFLCTIAAIFLMWRDYVSPPTFVGQVEPVVADGEVDVVGTACNALARTCPDAVVRPEISTTGVDVLLGVLDVRVDDGIPLNLGVVIVTSGLGEGENIVRVAQVDLNSRILILVVGE